MNLTIFLYWLTLVVYLNARNIANEELAIVVHRLVGDVGILKQVARDQATILHKQDQVITAMQSSVNLFTQVAALLQKTVASLDGKLGEQTADMKTTKSKLQVAESNIRNLKANQEDVVQNYFSKYRVRFIGIGWYKSQDDYDNVGSVSSLTKCIEVCHRKRQESSKWNGISYSPEAKSCYCYANDQGHQGAMHDDYYSQWLHYRFE